MNGSKHLFNYFKNISARISSERWHSYALAFRGLTLPVPSVHARTFHSSLLLSYKIYEDVENNHCHEVMEKYPHAYSISKIEEPGEPVDIDRFLRIVKAPREGADPESLLRDYALLSDYAARYKICISEPKFDEFVDALADGVLAMDEDQLERVFRNALKWPETEAVQTRNFIEIWTALDHACELKINDMTIERALLFADYFYRLNLARQSDFVYKVTKKYVDPRKLSKLSPGQLVQTVFLQALTRWAPKEKYAFEHRLGQFVDDLTLEEISVFCLGFFKSQCHFKNPKVYYRLIERTIAEAKTLDGPTLCAALKMIQYSSSYMKDYRIRELLDLFADEVGRLSFLNCTHLATVGIPLKIKSPKLLDAVVEKFLKNPSEARAKDLERLALAFSMFNVDRRTNVYDAIVDELRKPERLPEIERYRMSFGICLSFLTSVGAYPSDLIAKALSAETTGALNLRDKKYLHYLTLDAAAEMYCEDYRGDRLTDKVRKNLWKACVEEIPSCDHKHRLSLSNAVALEALLLLSELRGGSKNVIAAHTFPEFIRADLILCDDLAGNPLPVGDELAHELGSILRPPNKNRWCAIQIVGKDSLELYTGEILGPARKKMRMLNDLGYEQMTIKTTDWYELATERQKLEFLVKLLGDNNIYYDVNFHSEKDKILPKEYVYRNK